MGYDLTFKGSNTCNIDGADYATTINDYVYDDFFTLNSDFGWTDGFEIRDNAPIFVKDNGTNDFTWDTGIYPYEDLVCKLLGKSKFNKTYEFLLSEIQKRPKTKYIFIQIF